MKSLAILLCLTLVGCAAHREQNYVRRCAHAGFQPGTELHARCVDNLKMEAAYGPVIFPR